MFPDLVPIRRALISVSDKTGLLPLAAGLAAREVELLSTGGTAAGAARRRAAGARRERGDRVSRDARRAGEDAAPHGARRPPRAARPARPRGGAGGATASRPSTSSSSTSTPSRRRWRRAATWTPASRTSTSAGRRCCARRRRTTASSRSSPTSRTTPPSSPSSSGTGGATSLAFRRAAALTAFGRTAAYDAAVSGWMAGALGEAAPRRRSFAGTLAQPLRYGENPHQGAAFYRDGSDRPGVATARQLQGKALSYNNINDTDAAFELVAEFAPADGPACAIIKHANPCGVARGASLLDAYRAAYDCDRTSAFGGIVALNGTLDAETAAAIAEIFTEVVIAPEVDRGGGGGLRGEEEPPPPRHRRPARRPRPGPRLAAGGRRLPGAGPRQRPARSGRAQGRHPPRARRRPSSPTSASPGPWPSTSSRTPSSTRRTAPRSASARGR